MQSFNMAVVGGWKEFHIPATRPLPRDAKFNSSRLQIAVLRKTGHKGVGVAVPCCLRPVGDRFGC
jgi:hypothetical protein